MLAAAVRFVFIVIPFKEATKHSFMILSFNKREFRRQPYLQMSHTSDSDLHHCLLIRRCIPVFKTLRWDWPSNWRVANFLFCFEICAKLRQQRGRRNCFLAKTRPSRDLEQNPALTSHSEVRPVLLIVWYFQLHHFAVGMNRQITLAENLTGCSLWPWKCPVSSLALAHIPAPVRDERGLSGWFMPFL